jgi:gamma-glutamylputrescine oxidase
MSAWWARATRGCRRRSTWPRRGATWCCSRRNALGFGASGRNGGQLGSGQRRTRPSSKRCWAATPRTGSGTSARRPRRWCATCRTARHRLRGATRRGGRAYRPADVDEIIATPRTWRPHYGYDRIEALDRDALHASARIAAYRRRGLDRLGRGALHPLRFALGLARAAEAAGVRIFERSEVPRVVKPGARPRSKPRPGRSTADHVILACQRLSRRAGAPDRRPGHADQQLHRRHRTPGQTRAPEMLPRDVAVADSRSW